MLRRRAAAELAGFKVPKRVLVVDELPRNTMGKVEKARLRAQSHRRLTYRSFPKLRLSGESR